MASLQEQIDFVAKEQAHCKRVYTHLQEEFGHKNVAWLGQELREHIRLSEAILTSLKKLQSKP